MSTTVGPVGWAYLAFMGLALPWAALRSARALEAGALPLRRRFLVSVVVQQLLLAALALWVASREGIAVSWRVNRPLEAGLLGVALTVGMILLARPLWRAAVQRRERRAYLTMPRTPGERVLWLGVSVAAGVGEEVAYRAVLVALLLRVVGSPWPAAAVASTCFALAHLVQGGRAALIVGFAGLVLQVLVWHSGGLAAAMAVHATYDLVAGLAYGWYGERFGYPVEPMPADGPDPDGPDPDGSPGPTGREAAA